jgi:hypothetical protein
MRVCLVSGLAALVLSLNGCSKRYVDFTVTNQSGHELRVVEFDYPGGSFGTTKLDAGQSFHYHFKSLHDGSLKLLFTDVSGKSHESDGPAWRERESGQVSTVVDADAKVTWQVQRGQ